MSASGVDGAPPAPRWAALLDEAEALLPDHPALAVLRRRQGSAVPRVGLVGAAKAGRSTVLNTIAGAPLVHTTARRQDSAPIELLRGRPAALWTGGLRGGADALGGEGVAEAAAAATAGPRERVCIRWPGALSGAVWVELPADRHPDHPDWLELDGVLLVSDAQQALSRDQLDRLGALMPGLPVVGLVLSRADRVRENALADGVSEEDALSMACRSGAARLAWLVDGEVPTWTSPPLDGPAQLAPRLAALAPALEARARAAERALLDQLVAALDQSERQQLAALAAHPAAGRPSLAEAAASAAAEVGPAVVAAVRACLERATDRACAQLQAGEGDVGRLLGGATTKPELRARARELAAERERQRAAAAQGAQVEYTRLIVPTLRHLAGRAAAGAAAVLGQAGTDTPLPVSPPSWPSPETARAAAAENPDSLDALETHDRDRRRWMASAAAAGAVAGAVLGGGLLVPAAVAGGVATAAYNSLTPLTALQERLNQELSTAHATALAALRTELEALRPALELAAEDAVLQAVQHATATAAFADADAQQRAELEALRTHTAARLATLATLRAGLVAARPAVPSPPASGLAGSPWVPSAPPEL